MFTQELTVHGAVKVATRPPYDMAVGGRIIEVRKLTITGRDGGELNITMFSEDDQNIVVE